MEGVGPGTTLDGRYTTQRRIEQRHGCERWTADDTTLGRSVVVLCLPDSDHRASAVLDAGRRAAGLDTPTLHRVLDAGRERGVAWVIESDVADSRSLAQLVHDGGLPADEVRRIVGEVATALESARQRGLHHLDLRPEDVLRTVDGEVRLRGVATSAAIVELDDVESEDASRRDAIGVVSLTYAGLTGLWPGPGATSLGSAPRVLGGVAAPSEIAAGVPRDLDALCRLTLGDDQGPTSPGDFARQIAPWPSRQVAGRSTIATTAAVDPRVPTALSPAALAPAALAPAALTPAALTPQASTEVLPTTAPEPDPSTGADPDSEPLAGPDAQDAPTEDDDEPTRVLQRPTSTSAPTEAIPVTGAASAGATPPPADSTAELPRVRPSSTVPEPTATGAEAGPVGSDPSGDGDAAPRAATTAAAAAAAAGAAMAGAGSAVAEAMSRAGSRVGSLGRQVGERAAEKAAERRGFHERITAPNAPGLTDDGDHVRPGTGSDAFLEPPAPLVPAEPLTKDESKVALAIVAAFLVVALIGGIYGVMQIGSKTNVDFGGVPNRAASASAGAATKSPTPAKTGATPNSSGEKLQILAADGFDPQGDGRENGTRAPRVFDGDPSTAWQSEGYSSAALGGLKQGVGVVVDLGPNVAAREISLTLGNRADVEVYIGADKSLTGAVKVGTKASADGTVTFPVKAGTTGQYVIVWFTKLSQDGNGRYRAILGEVEVKS
ncbi:hypothetical protein GCM10022415_12490 [Knoellia locipacati]|uniref:Protein kinase domain-containing protein n=1 Tax=Knoellia locipacati TaxID=882824 RepID=A0A512SZ15_9MICO|nr:hypothetical protein [Knoellia locipacati]GEQ13199.1 hypothetical protein KLO01_12460 [Knoellia locipacati]